MSSVDAAICHLMYCKAGDIQSACLDLLGMCLQVVNELRLECAGKDDTGRTRSPAAVAWSLQRYLIFAILCCIPGAHS